MKCKILVKTVAFGFVLIASAMSVSAQKINEKELKVNVDKISTATQQLKNLEPVTFNYDTKKFNYLQLPTGGQYGFLVSNVLPEFPQMVTEVSKQYNAGKNDSKVVKYNEVQTENLIPVLVAAIKEQQAEIELLKKELNVLKAKAK
ncbi:tail fiber domain-containing protein [Pedobacter sp. N36a]|uniref:tail fiber domain-containing protein n=1 Tax=Pedobacter sp. N36a TaxID=2767996 RepID=UPI0016570E46|nr:tail fiber domain-containing protein [Pedobacter sp. N36a]MBC8988255.1 tail fiber domain-containing protein [Pedobacter sp. N36a]